MSDQIPGGQGMGNHLVQKLAPHVNHVVSIVQYGTLRPVDNWANHLALECDLCGVVIFDTDLYDLLGLEAPGPLLEAAAPTQLRRPDETIPVPIRFPAEIRVYDGPGEPGTGKSPDLPRQPLNEPSRVLEGPHVGDSEHAATGVPRQLREDAVARGIVGAGEFSFAVYDGTDLADRDRLEANVTEALVRQRLEAAEAFVEQLGQRFRGDRLAQIEARLERETTRWNDDATDAEPDMRWLIAEVKRLRTEQRKEDKPSDVSGDDGSA